MKIEQPVTGFKPIVITLETLNEARALKAAVGAFVGAFVGDQHSSPRDLTDELWEALDGLGVESFVYTNRKRGDDPVLKFLPYAEQPDQGDDE